MTPEQQMRHMDEIAAAVRDVLQERGIDATVTIPERIEGGLLRFEVTGSDGSPFSNEEYESILAEALPRVGLELGDDEN